MMSPGMSVLEHELLYHMQLDNYVFHEAKK